VDADRVPPEPLMSWRIICLEGNAAICPQRLPDHWAIGLASASVTVVKGPDYLQWTMKSTPNDLCLHGADFEVLNGRLQGLFRHEVAV